MTEEKKVQDAHSHKIWDCIMIGAGPAALSAAVYTTREDISTLLFEKGVIGGLAAITDWIDNYPGFPKGIAGLELADNLRLQAERFGAVIELGEVTDISDEGEYKLLKTTSGDFKARTVLLATGSEYKKLGIPGETEYFARGVHYCATCDGAFYRDKNLVIVGGGNSALQEAMFLTRYASHIVVAIFLSDLGTNLLSNVNGYIGDQMSARLYKSLGRQYYEHLLSLPQSYFDQELTGKIINRLNRSAVQISGFMQMWSNSFLQFIFSTVLALAIVAFYSWPVALLLFTLYPIFILMTVKASGIWQGYQKKINHNTDMASGRFAEAIGQVKVVKSFIQEKKELKYFDKHTNKVLEYTKPQSKYWHTKDVQRRLALNVIFFAVYLFIFIQAADGYLSAGQAVALILYAMQIRIPIFTISFLVENTQRAIADSKDYFEIMDMMPDIADHQDAKNLKVSKGEIRFDNMSFGYGDKHVLHNISFSVEPDSKMALVGESGEGKTTLTNLLLRLYEPESGAITIDGINIQDVTQLSLRQNIGVVFQDPALFSGTIKENIAYGDMNASKEKIIAAARDANADEFINKLEKGYYTEIGERGLKLSGGQKQRIAIARALLKDAPILILDEATSSLDSKSEAMVQQALERLMKGRTTLIIAHRLSTIQNVDKIITLASGKVAEVGPPEELAVSGGIYSQLLKLQQGKTAISKKKLKEFEISN